MQQTQCDGCGLAEDMGMPKPKIKKVTMSIVEEPRFPTGTKRHDADLCPDCIGKLLFRYFRVRAEGDLDLPAFIEPQSLSVDR
jgi:hypothetical protein